MKSVLLTVLKFLFKVVKFVLHSAFTLSVAAVCCALVIGILPSLVYYPGNAETVQADAVQAVVSDRHDMLVQGELNSALDGLIPIEIEVIYWLRDQDLIAPEPNPACYGSTTDPLVIDSVIEQAADLLEGQTLHFSSDLPLMPGSKIQYYLDETILVITWKQIIRDVVFTMSEVKIAHPTQFRRFLAGGEYGTAMQYTTTEMASSVNAVVASAGDFYGFRQAGCRVYEGKVYRAGGRIDTCMIDDMGNMILVDGNTLNTVEQAQKFVDENHVRFSLTFGPNLIKDGVRCEPSDYPLGEINGHYSRAALCQMGNLHYMMVVVGEEDGYARRQQLKVFVDYLVEFGAQQAYALDGGQTATIAMDGELVNDPDYSVQRKISDIIYFATALPESMWE